MQRKVWLSGDPENDKVSVMETNMLRQTFDLVNNNNIIIKLQVDFGL